MSSVGLTNIGENTMLLTLPASKLDNEVVDEEELLFLFIGPLGSSNPCCLTTPLITSSGLAINISSNED